MTHRLTFEEKAPSRSFSKDGKKKILTNVYYIPNLKSNIISLGQATESGCDVRMREAYLTLYDRDGNRLYKVTLRVDGLKYLQHASLGDESSTWHARLVHIGTETMRSMMKKSIVTGIPELSLDKEICQACMMGKQTRKSFPKATSYRATQVLELVHGDLCGPISPPTAANNRYIFVLIDDYSRYMWTILMKEKGEAFDKFKKFKSIVEKETGKSIKSFRTNRGGEFTSHEFKDFCDLNGINQHLTAPYLPQQNGIVERCNMTLMEMTRSTMKHMSIPNYLWGEAVRNSTYLINRMATRTLKDLTPYECFKNKRPSVGHVRVFGCVCYAKNDTPHLKKLEDRSRALVHLGIEPGSKAYRLYNPTSRKITVSRDVVFDEETSWEWNVTEEERSVEQGILTLGPQNNGENNNSSSGDEKTAENSECSEEETEDLQETEDL